MTTNDKIVALYRYCETQDCYNSCSLADFCKNVPCNFVDLTEEQINEYFQIAFELDSEDECQKEEPELESVKIADDAFDTVVAIRSSRKITSIDIYFDTEGENG